jgi:SAM-dependent methyltransferase
MNKNNKKFTPVFVHGSPAIKWDSSKDAMSSTYTTRDSGYPSFPLSFDANPHSDECLKAKKVLDLGCGIGRNLKWIMENTEAHYYGMEPNKSMSQFFWDWNDEKYKDRVTIVSSWEELSGIEFDVMLSTFVLMHITYNVPTDVWNVSDIVDEMKKHANKETIWVMFEHDNEYGGWQEKMFAECGITPEVHIRHFKEIESQTHRDEFGGGGHNLIIWKGTGGK